jgi:hypothetical protein
VTKLKVAAAINQLGGNTQAFKFTNDGLVTWTIE